MSEPVAGGTGQDREDERGGVLERDQSSSATRYEPEPPDDGAGGRAGRFWSTRRIPAALVSLVVLGAAGLLLYDIAAVRAGHPAMSWRRELAGELARQPLDQTWMLVAAAVAMALGVWLIVLALTPGLRGVLPMRRDFGEVRAGLDREAAALVLRDRAMEVSGVQSARVRVGRSKVKARAQSHFRELDDVRADLRDVLGTGVRELGLARPPALSVRVRRPTRKR
ncbi:DUF6286 domain-containing protein [Streptomyces sp. AK02-01A]|uniref:DUF6286 domain-containing protein n=1 Tax=Streptomyces sp. AK02-01A TaxID=3028648 RepID=UPI0029A78359|nr:DUF6286 domain-containing protein [Streptomyces sp. AK02-01A]MDX3851481.1 DUF6286 domain-containing protein [Streptomyces sp. AK02-01A]